MWDPSPAGSSSAFLPVKNPLRQTTRKIHELLLQGLTPERIALTLVCGAFVGINPAIGTTTLLCTAIALGLGLNLALIQIVNYAVYPLEILFLLPFIELGHWLVSGNPLTLSRHEILSWFQAGWIHALGQFWVYLLEGLLGWTVTSLLFAPAVYVLFSRLLRRLWQKSPGSPTPLTAARDRDK